MTDSNFAVNLIMPMGGKGERFSKDGIVLPKPLIELHGKPFFYWSVQSVLQFIEVDKLIFVTLKEHHLKFDIDGVIKTYYPESEFVFLDEVLRGAVLTCMEGVKKITNNNPVIFNDCDHLFYAPDFYNFCRTGDFLSIDGALLTFKSHEPKFSFLEYGDNGYVKRTVEKEAISDDAICGVYYFKNKDVFLDSANDYLNNCGYNEYFISGVYNSLALHGGRIKGFPCDIHVPFGTPAEWKAAEQFTGWDILQ